MTAALERAYLELLPSARQRAESGQPVVGIVGRDVPAVLVSAAGAQPYRLGAGRQAAAPSAAPSAAQSAAEATAIMGGAVDRAALVLLAEILSGSLDFLAGILIAHDCEASVRLHFALQELYRRGSSTIPVHLVDQVHLDRPSTLRFNTHQLEAMTDVLRSWTGSGITRDALESAHAEHSMVRASLSDVQVARRTRRMSGLSALHAYAVGVGSSPAAALALLEGRERGADTADALPVFLTGSAPIGDELYRAIEDAGAVVVGEDHDWGDPILSDLLPERLPAELPDALRELALSRLHGDPASASSTMAARAAATRSGVEATRARALLSIVRPHDEAPLWDWKRQRELAGVPHLEVRGEAAEDPSAVAAAIGELRAAS
ncbi:2-hydroxyacyl-CoA dehydratase family protein [Naasia lichenicola]|uniref:2-hydroxyacyl-CoA dehydratase family protein n=1 Tax=Naasia lichenicola TaxID=2565933 RepID=UPI00130EB920|nr:2-hydroxyacyl-CoA dehydratase family protein [Naasia lichenicola]